MKSGNMPLQLKKVSKCTQICNLYFINYILKQIKIYFSAIHQNMEYFKQTKNVKMQATTIYGTDKSRTKSKTLLRPICRDNW